MKVFHSFQTEGLETSGQSEGILQWKYNPFRMSCDVSVTQGPLVRTSHYRETRYLIKPRSLAGANLSPENQDYQTLQTCML